MEKKTFRLCMQDEARHVAYGVMHLKYFLEKHPERKPENHDILQRGEEATFSLNYAVAMQPPLASYYWPGPAS